MSESWFSRMLILGNQSEECQPKEEGQARVIAAEEFIWVRVGFIT